MAGRDTKILNNYERAGLNGKTAKIIIDQLDPDVITLEIVCGEKIRVVAIYDPGPLSLPVIRLVRED